MGGGRISFTLFLLFIIHSVTTDNSRDKLLKQLLQQNAKVPFVVLLKNRNNPTDIQPNKVYSSDDEAPEPPHDDKVYMLYHILRTTREKEDLDDDAAIKLDRTENILRQALRKRCNKLDKCVKKCPVKKFTCTVTCKEVYDNYDVCKNLKKENKCKKPKCGKTKPPRWLLRNFE